MAAELLARRNEHWLVDMGSRGVHGTFAVGLMLISLKGIPDLTGFASFIGFAAARFDDYECDCDNAYSLHF